MPPKRPIRLVRKEYNRRLEQNRRNDVITPCLGDPERFVDYRRRDEPTPEEAEEMCFDCPMLALCDEYAVVVERPITGVWGGRVWRPVSKGSTEGVPLPRPERIAA